MLNKYATNIDTLITEGTMLSRDEDCPHESVISERMAKVMAKYKYVFVLASATDIERLVSIKSATRVAHKRLCVCSRFMDDTMKFFTGREGWLPWSKYHLSHEFFDEKKIELYKKDGFVMVTGTGSKESVRKYIAMLDPSETILIYSSWDGYYKLEEQVRTNSAYKDFRDMFPNIVDIHTSGHADRKTIEQVVKIVNAKNETIVIHKEKDAKL